MRWFTFGLLAASLVLVAQDASAAPPLTTTDATTLRALIRPLDNEDPFDTIPWEIRLWDARKKAATAGKPVLLWEMDGHPLGCG